MVAEVVKAAVETVAEIAAADATTATPPEGTIGVVRHPVSLKRKMTTTDYTEYTDFKRVMKVGAFTQQVNASILVTHSLSAFI